MKVTYVDHMGSDLSVVNAARVSFAKRSEQPRGSDCSLIKYLARHNHWTPFGHTGVTLHMRAPLFVARQLGKHQIGLVWNEVSRRYVKDEPDFYVPDSFRPSAESVKQGSGDGSVEVNSELVQWMYAHEQALFAYNDMLSKGVCAEQARMVLPQSMYTEWYWTGSVASFARVYDLRSKPDTQRETQEIARQIDEVVSPLFPVSWASLTRVSIGD